MVEPAQWMEPEDPEILQTFRENQTSWLRDLDESGELNWSIEYTYSRCKQLALHGLLQDLGCRTYHLTEAGSQYLSEEFDPDNPHTIDRIIDLSTISAANFKYRNMKFLHGSTPYELQSHKRLVDARTEIWRVRNGDLRSVLRRFPRDEPLINQCALWMRAWTGKHFFPDANHRTAIATLRELLVSSGFEITQWPVHRTVSAIRESKAIRVQTRYELDTLYSKDMHYYVWWFHFVDVLKTELKEASYSASTSPRAR